MGRLTDLIYGDITHKGRQKPDEFTQRGLLPGEAKPVLPLPQGGQPGNEIPSATISAMP